jgi:putative membrane protein
VRPLERESREFRRANDLLFGTLCPVLGRWLTWLTGDELANDRTYLAWLRTGIALFGLGFVVAKVALIVQPDTKVLSDRGLYSGVGVLIVLSGAMLIVVGYLQHVAVAKVLKRDAEASRPRWPLTITVVAGAGSLLLTGLIVVTT